MATCSIMDIAVVRHHWQFSFLCQWVTSEDPATWSTQVWPKGLCMGKEPPPPPPTHTLWDANVEAQG